jgi:hypothetical protein
MKKSDAPPPKADPTTLELPDWSGMDDSSVRITPEAALRLTELYPRLAASASGGKGLERSQPCPVEFVL